MNLWRPLHTNCNKHIYIYISFYAYYAVVQLYRNYFTRLLLLYDINSWNNKRQFFFLLLNYTHTQCQFLLHLSINLLLLLSIISCITHQFIQTHKMKHLWHQIKRKPYKMLERNINKFVGWYIMVWMKLCPRKLQIYATSSN